MHDPGGTPGGLQKFGLGLLLSAVSLYFFFDSVHVATREAGLISGLMGGRFQTTSMGIIFLPFFIGIVALFTNAKMKWAWIVTWIGLAIIVIEILSRIYFLMSMKTSHLLIMIVTFAAGAGLMLRSYRDESAAQKKSKPDERS
ncbi:MAG: hypothetical protein ACI9DF_000521 [Verrucomicrobiales bacterium]|jgi:hypothetical protein